MGIQLVMIQTACSSQMFSDDCDIIVTSYGMVLQSAPAQQIPQASGSGWLRWGHCTWRYRGGNC